MGTKIDMTGNRYGRLIVISEASIDNSGAITWLCRCDCGNETIISGTSLRRKNRPSMSCGCLNREVISKMLKNRTKHKHPMYGKRGKNTSRYNHNLTDKEREDRRALPEYRGWRTAVYEKDNYTCQCCGDNTGGNLNAHHIEGYRSNPEVRTMVSNGVTLCEYCHKNFHHNYGYGNNTRKQFEEFLSKTKEGDY